MIEKVITAFTLTVFSGILFAICIRRMSSEDEPAVIKVINWLCAGYIPPLILIYMKSSKHNIFHLLAMFLFCPLLWAVFGIFRKYRYKGSLKFFIFAALLSAMGLIVQFRLGLYLPKGLLAKLFGGESGILMAISQLIYVAVSLIISSYLVASGHLSRYLRVIESRTTAMFWGVVSLSFLGLLFFSKIVSGAKAPTLLGGSIQPTELVYKFVFIFFIAKYLSSKAAAMSLSSYPTRETVKEILMLSLFVCVFFLAPMLIEMGTGVLLFITFIVLLTLLSRQRYLIPLGALIVVVMMSAGTLFSTRLEERVFGAWLNWQKNIRGAGMQPFHAYSAFNGSDIFGVGITNGFPKLPKVASDYVLVPIVEEWGIVGLSIIIAANLFLLKEIYLTHRAGPDFKGIVLYGLPLTLVIQSYYHITANLGMWILSGIPLPFISMGGSACMTSFLTIAAITVLFNESQEGKREEINE